MARAPRRIVTGNNAQGRSTILVDGPPTSVGAYWMPDSLPGDNSGSADAAARVNTLEPPHGGSYFRFATIPPEDPGVPAAERERRTAKMFAQMNASQCRGDISQHPGMHKTRTIDYVILLSGKVTLLLNEAQVELEPFDVVVQRGTDHAWINHGSVPALIAAVLIDAKE